MPLMISSLVSLPLRTLALYVYSTPPILSSVSIAPDDVYVKLHNLDPNKSAGPDNWPTKVLKDMAEQLCLPLTILFTKSIQTSTLPDAWIRGHVIPVHKKGDCKCVDNYCPITLTSVVDKLLESIIKDHILDHFFENNLFTPYQHGFLPKRSCVTQLLSAIENWSRL